MTGTRPVIDFMFADFVLDAVGEIVNQIAKMQYMSSGRLKMPDPPARLHRHRPFGGDASLGQLLSACTLISRACAWSCPRRPTMPRDCCTHALRCDDPVLFLEHRELLALKGPVPAGDDEIAFGQAAMVREGSDVTVVALALMVQRTLKACAALASEGISVELIDPRTVAPLISIRSPRSVAKTGRLLIVDEAFGPAASAPRSPPRLPTAASTISMPRSAG